MIAELEEVILLDETDDEDLMEEDTPQIIVLTDTKARTLVDWDKRIWRWPDSMMLMADDRVEVSIANMKRGWTHLKR